MEQRAVLRPYLDGLQIKLAKQFPTTSGKYVNLTRFADDFIITGRSKEILENEVKPLVEAFLKERGLTLSESKTRITHINEGFDFLGKHIRKYNGKFLTKPSRKNVRAFLAEIKATIRENRHTPVEELITLLNPKIRGWALFHRSSSSKEIFNYVDYRIFCELQRWMQGRHPGKSLSWCDRKYLTRVGNRNYVLQGTYLDLSDSARQLNRRNRDKTPSDVLFKRLSSAKYPHRHSPMREQEEQSGDQQSDAQNDFSSYG